MAASMKEYINITLAGGESTTIVTSLPLDGLDTFTIKYKNVRFDKERTVTIKKGVSRTISTVDRLKIEYDGQKTFVITNMESMEYIIEYISSDTRIYGFAYDKSRTLIVPLPYDGSHSREIDTVIDNDDSSPTEIEINYTGVLFLTSKVVMYDPSADFIYISKATVSGYVKRTPSDTVTFTDLDRYLRPAWEIIVKRNGENTSVDSMARIGTPLIIPVTKGDVITLELTSEAKSKLRSVDIYGYLLSLEM